MAKAKKDTGPSKQAIEESKANWSSFTQWMKWTVIAVCATLVIMAAAFIR